MTPLYLRKVGTNECFAFSPYLEARKDMIPWNGPLPWEKVEAVAPIKAAIAIAAPEKTATTDPPKPDEEKKEDTGFKCTVCGKICATKLGLAAHMRSHK